MTIADKFLGYEVLDLENLILLENYRAKFNQHDLIELAISMDQKGQLQPVIVNRTKEGVDELVAGQRRYISKKDILKDKTIKCVVYLDMTIEEMLEMQLDENIKRPILSASKAEAIGRTKAFVEKKQKREYTKKEYSELIKVAYSTVKDALNYYKAPAKAKDLAQKGEISYSIVVQIGRLEKKHQQRTLDEILCKEITNAKVLRKYITVLKKESGKDEEKKKLEEEKKSEQLLSGKEWLISQDAKGEFEQLDINKIHKEYCSALRNAATYLRTLYLFACKNKECEEKVKSFNIHNLSLTNIISSLSKNSEKLEQKLEKHHALTLKRVLDPKSVEDILTDYEKQANDLIKNAEFAFININNIYPDKNQPRNTNHPDYQEYVDVLSKSIKNKGVIEPILLVKRPKGKHEYRLVFGESRWRGATKAELEKIPALIAELTDEQCLILQLTEDLYKKDTPHERVKAITHLEKILKDKGLYIKEDFYEKIDSMLGMKKSEARMYKTFLLLSEYVQNAVYEKHLTLTAAVKELARIQDPGLRDDACKVILSDKLKGYSIKSLVNEVVQRKDNWFPELKEEFSEAVGELAEKKVIIDKSIKSLSELERKLRNTLPAQKEVYTTKIIKAYADFKTALDKFETIYEK